MAWEVVKDGQRSHRAWHDTQAAEVGAEEAADQSIDDDTCMGSSGFTASTATIGKIPQIRSQEQAMILS